MWSPVIIFNNNSRYLAPQGGRDEQTYIHIAHVAVMVLVVIVYGVAKGVGDIIRGGSSSGGGGCCCW